jgi:hypothetical protein
MATARPGDLQGSGSGLPTIGRLCSLLLAEVRARCSRPTGLRWTGKNRATRSFLPRRPCRPTARLFSNEHEGIAAPQRLPGCAIRVPDHLDTQSPDACVQRHRRFVADLSAWACSDAVARLTSPPGRLPPRCVRPFLWQETPLPPPCSRDKTWEVLLNRNEVNLCSARLRRVTLRQAPRYGASSEQLLIKAQVLCRSS